MTKSLNYYMKILPKNVCENIYSHILDEKYTKNNLSDRLDKNQYGYIDRHIQLMYKNKLKKQRDT